ncbi:hypothetical protein [Paenibacillus sp. DMB5]|uniref:hypothetical protein n=1 Tax=Paenibacillus sp. DMB5 TaxID=1780103 RepID=UPI00076D2817|nr:hypothetical protein [Paenibacillus sp. DMB5]KUP22062.1 hypothetical protein AWJ19_21365 [Paenibacillus sp. DMB5]
MATITLYQIIDGNVMIDFNRFCDNAANCQEQEIEKDFDNRSYQVNDTEVALNEIRSFIRSSIEQLKNGNKVVLTGANGRQQKVFDDLESFKDWVNAFFSLSRYQFIMARVVDKEFSTK